MSQSAILYDTEFFLNGTLPELDRLADNVGRFCSSHGLGNDVAFELNLVLEELFVNSVRHGGCESVRNAVRVRLGVAAHVALEYRDRGHPFDPTSAAAPDLQAPLEQRNAGGLGIHLVRRLMQDVEYRREGDWNQITMKYRHAESGGL